MPILRSVLPRVLVAVAAVTVLTLLPAAAASAEDTGTIAGHVTDTSGHPVRFAQVDVYDAAGAPVFVTGAGFGDGHFLFTLPPGTYRLRARPLVNSPDYPPAFTLTDDEQNFVAQYYAGQTTLAAATPIVVGAGAAVTGIDIALQTGNKISGAVTDAAGQPVNGGTVQAIDAQGAAAGSSPIVAGHYAIPRLAPGDYRVQFLPAGNGLVGRFYGGFATLGTAVPVTATPTTTGIDGHLDAGGSIKGRILDEKGLAVSGMIALAYSDADHDERIRFGNADATGNYVISGLLPGTFHVAFVPVSAGLGGPDTPEQWFDRAATRAASRPVTVTAGAVTSGVDAQLIRHPPSPVAKVSSRTVAVASGRTAKVGLACQEKVVCQGTASLSVKYAVKVHGRTRSRVSVIGSAAYTIPAGSSRTVPVTLSGTGRSLLKRARGKKLRATLSLVSKPNPVQATTTVTLTARR